MEEESKDGDWKAIDTNQFYIRLLILTILVLFGLGVTVAIIGGYTNYGETSVVNTHIDREKHI